VLAVFQMIVLAVSCGLMVPTTLAGFPVFSVAVFPGLLPPVMLATFSLANVLSNNRMSYRSYSTLVCRYISCIHIQRFRCGVLVQMIFQGDTGICMPSIVLFSARLRPDNPQALAAFWLPVYALFRLEFRDAVRLRLACSVRRPRLSRHWQYF
jgi:hypothetical protein